MEGRGSAVQEAEDDAGNEDDAEKEDDALRMESSAASCRCQLPARIVTISQ